MPTCAYAHVSILGRNAFDAHQQARAHSLSSGLQLTEPYQSIRAAFEHEHLWAEHMPTCAYALVSMLGMSTFLERHKRDAFAVLKPAAY